MAVGVALIADVTAAENRSVCIGLLIATGSIGIVSAPIGAILPYDLTFVLSNIISVVRGLPLHAHLLAAHECD